MSSDGCAWKALRADPALCPRTRHPASILHQGEHLAPRGTAPGAQILLSKATEQDHRPSMAILIWGFSNAPCRAPPAGANLVPEDLTAPHAFKAS